VIHGTVNARHEAVLSFRVRGPSGTELDIEAAIDTGATPALTLPAATIAALNLTFQTSNPAMLADGTILTIDTYNAEIEWDGAWLAILVSEVESNPLVGTRLLAHHELFIEFNPGGVVEIRALP
jgi:clan AA aspartic protease